MSECGNRAVPLPRDRHQLAAALETEDRLAARHLSLWIYGHIVEAAAPYDLLANLANLANLAKVAQGEQARMTWLPDERGRKPEPAGSR